MKRKHSKRRRLPMPTIISSIHCANGAASPNKPENVLWIRFQIAFKYSDAIDLMRQKR